MLRIRSILFLLLAFHTAFAAQTQPLPTAAEITAKWRSAVSAKHTAKAAVMLSNSDEDGIPGKVEEWVTVGGDYRRVVTRAFDQSETVVSSSAHVHRDWNGFLRPLAGEELRRLRTAIFEQQSLIFGPPIVGATGRDGDSLQSAVSRSDDGQYLLLRMTPPGGAPVTWFIDTATSLPAKSTRPGNDSTITSTYEDWRTMGGVLTPHRVHVSESEKPAYQWERAKIELRPDLPKSTLAAPRPGPSDVRLEANAPPIPFNFESAHIIFDVQVNGRPAIPFLLDTGADQEVINETRLAEFGLKTYAKTQATGGGNTADYSYAEGATFTLPGVELRNQHVAVIDQTGLERALGMPLGGLLGYDFISRFVVDIDYQKKLIRLYDPAKWKYSGNGFIVPIVFDEGIPFTHGSISVATKPNIPAYFVIDFGAAETMTLTSPFVKANDLANLAQTNATVNRPAGMEKQFFAQNNVRGHIDQLKLGDFTADSIPVNMSVNTTGAYASTTFSGTIGETLFRRYHVFLDYARNRVILEPTAEAAKPFAERRTYGLGLLASGADLHIYTVTSVRAGSGAERDGFKKGDIIAAVEGKPASQFTLGELRDKLTEEGARYSVDIVRADEHLTRSVQVTLVSLDQK